MFKKNKKFRPTILMYHEISQYPEKKKTIRKIDPAYSMWLQDFKNQMYFLLSHGYNILPLNNLINDEIMTPKSISLTFDDGLIGNYKCAFPVLQELGIKATFFVEVDKINDQRHMNWNHLRELNLGGHMVQSHTMSHPSLGESEKNHIFYELSKSKEIIEEKINSSVEYVSLPFGSYNHYVMEIAREVGYKAIFTSRIYQNKRNRIPYIYGRIPIKDNHTNDYIKKLLKPRSKEFIQLIFFDQVKYYVKQLIGLNNYRKIYRYVYNIKID